MQEGASTGKRDYGRDVCRLKDQAMKACVRRGFNSRHWMDVGSWMHDRVAISLGTETRTPL